MRPTTRYRLNTVLSSLLLAIVLIGSSIGSHSAVAQTDAAPVPLLRTGTPTDWWFVFKFNTAAFPGCGGTLVRQCPFGGIPQNYKGDLWGQQFAVASSGAPALQKGNECVGDTTAEPLGATYSEIYNGRYFYVVWNDQFYDDPKIGGCSKECGGPWGHSKGVLAWDDAGEGVVLQVSTPSWPASGSSAFPRKTDGNTLGCVRDDDVEVSQHFFSLKLTKSDVVALLKALQNASVVTDPANPQIVRNGGPADIQAAVATLGTKSKSKDFVKETLSSGVQLISKPSSLHVPPWQMVSSLLGGVSLRTASWWYDPKIPTTTSDTKISCWDDSLVSGPGAVEIATTGGFGGKTFGLIGGDAPDHNHAKVAVSTSGAAHYTILGDMNQQGALSGAKCGSSQNGRGGLFFVLGDPALFASVTQLLKGDTAPAGP